MTGGASDLNGTESFASVDKYNINRNQWSSAPSMNIPRFYHSSCCLGDNLYVFCGKNSSGKLNSIESISAASVVNNTSNTLW